MALTTLEIEVANPSTPMITRKLEFLIDSGAVYSVVPTSVLKKLKIEPSAEEKFQLDDGSKIIRKKGVAVFKYGHRVCRAEVVFGDDRDGHLLGTLTLQALGLAFDPLKRELRPFPMILA